MAENDRYIGAISKEKTPVTPAPTRSQANRASRAPGAENWPAEISGHETPQAAAKPPPGLPENSGRRRSDAEAEQNDFPEPALSGEGRVQQDSPGQTSRWSCRAIAAWLLMFMVCIVTGTGTAVRTGQPEKSVVIPPAPQLPVSMVKAGTAASEQKQDSAGLPGNPEGALTTALDDLDHALEDRSESPERILRTVSLPGNDCMLAWTSRYPSLIFGKKAGPNSIAVTLEGCAQAVARLPR